MSWDIHTKLLLKECPQDFVSYFAPGARYIRTRETQFQTRVDSAYEQREMRGDLVIEAEQNGVCFLIDPEFQSTRDDEMDERLLGYSYEATRLHKLNVLSGVFYLRSVGKAPQPPLRREIPNGFQAIWFNYISVEIGEKLVEEFRQLNLDGFWPWMVLCKDGATYKVVDEVLEYLQSRKRGNLILLTRVYADMVFTSDDDKAWLRRRFAMLQEFLWENTELYREVIEQGREQGIEQGREQGIEQGREQGIEQGREQGIEQGQVREARTNIEIIVQERFPALLALAKSRIELLSDLEQLQKLFLMVLRARTEEEIEQSLLAF